MSRWIVIANLCAHALVVDPGQHKRERWVEPPQAPAGRGVKFRAGDMIFAFEDSPGKFSSVRKRIAADRVSVDRREQVYRWLDRRDLVATKYGRDQPLYFEFGE